MLPLDLTSHLRRFLSILRDYDPQTLSYRSAISTLVPLNQLIASSIFRDGQSEYTTLLMRKVVLTLFELLCASSELIREVKYSFLELEKILAAVEQFSHHCSDGKSVRAQRPSYLTKKRKVCQTIDISSLIDVYLKSRVEWLVSALSNKPSSESLLHLVQFEHSFFRALLAAIATYTSLLLTDRDSGKKKQFVSAEMFSVHSKNTISWSNCLIPGAQSESLTIVCSDTFRRLWNRVAETLVERVQPLLVGNWNTQPFILWMRAASHNTGILRRELFCS